MSNISKIIGKNILYCMEENKISVVALSEILGISRQTLTKVLNGESVLDSEKLSIAASYFNKSLNYFFENTHDELSFMFRSINSKENCSKYERNFIESKMNNVVEVEKFIGKKYSFIPSQYSIETELRNRTLPKDIEELIESIALEQRESLDLGDCVGSDIISFLEDKGIKIIFEKMNNNQLFGVSAYHEKKGSFIFINDDQEIPEERKLFSVAHEYGHLIFHRELYKKELNFNAEYLSNRTSVNEKIADSFAGYFLIPRHILKNYDYLLKSKSITFSSLIFIKNELEVSIQTLLIALKKYGYIDNIQYQKGYKQLISNGYLKKEPNPIPYHDKNTKFLNSIKELYISDEIGVSKVAELLNIKIIEARKLVKGWCSDADDIQIFI